MTRVLPLMVFPSQLFTGRRRSVCVIITILIPALLYNGCHFFSHTPAGFPDKAVQPRYLQASWGWGREEVTELMLRLLIRHMLGSNGSEGCLNIYCHLHIHLGETFWIQIELLVACLGILL